MRNRNNARPRSRGVSAFRRECLPDPIQYFQSEGLVLVGHGEWRSTRCEFHDDVNPSMRVNIATGAFRCFACGVHGGDVLAYEMARYGIAFREAAERLGAWEDK